MARPLTEKEPIDVSLSSMISKNDMSKLQSMSYTCGIPKSEVIRRMIRFAYHFVNNECYKIRCEEEKSGNRYSMEELVLKVNENIDNEYLKFFDPETLQDGDVWITTSNSDFPTKWHKSEIEIHKGKK